MRRAIRFVLASLAGTLVMCAQPAAAALIGLSAPAAGSGAEAGDVIELTVSFDLNGVDATNLVGQELYVAFTGLVPVAGSYQLGSVFTPFGPDVLGLDGLCADVGCGQPADDPFSSQHYLSLTNVFAPSTPSGPGTLFTMQFTPAAGSTNWTLNLFGDDLTGLLWDPPPQACDPDDLTCDPDPAFATIPYQIVLPDEMVPPGIARVEVGIRAPTHGGPDPDPSVVPEPAALMLVGTGLLILTARRVRSAAWPAMWRRSVP